MSRTAELLSRLQQLGVRLWAEDERLRFDAPKNMMTPELRAELTSQKAELLRALSAPATKIPGIRPVNRNGPLPLSFAQQRMWFLNQLEEGTSNYNMTAALQMSGMLNVEMLERTFTEIVRRHEQLRTVFVADGGTPRQEILASPQIKIEVINLESSPGDHQSEIARLALEDLQYRFDLAHGPLLRLRLARFHAQEHVLFINMHHIVSDGWSVGVLVREIVEVYTAFYHRRPHELPELPIQYVDFAEFQRDAIETGQEYYARQLRYWMAQLANATTLLELPADRARPPVRTPRGGIIHFDIGADTTKKLKALAEQNNATLFMILHAAFVVLLFKYTRQEDILVGTPVANRNRKDIEPLIGLFLNTLVLRTDLSGDPSFKEVLQSVRKTAFEAFENQDVPFEKLVDALQLERTLSHNTLFQVLFLFQNFPLKKLSLPELTINPIEIDRDSANLDLTLEISEVVAQASRLPVDSAPALRAQFEYSRDIFEAQTIERYADHYCNLLNAIVRNPDHRLSQLSVLSAEERNRILVTWNEHERDFPREHCIQELIEEKVRQYPERIAMRDGDAYQTYAVTNLRANRIAHFLMHRGAGPETIVALMAERSIDFWTIMLGILKAGAIYLPIDPQHPPQRVSQVLEQSRPVLVIAANKFSDVLAQANSSSPIVLMEDLPKKDYPDTNPHIRTRPKNGAYVLFTSGSTGVPKGAMVEHLGMMNHVHAKLRDLGMTGADILVQNGPQCFDVSVWQFVGPLILGGQVCVCNDEVARDPALLVDRIEAQSVTVIEAVPSMIRMVLEELRHRGAQRPGFSKLRWMVPTGEVLPPEVCREWLGYYPNIPMMNTYGHTECSDDEAHYRFYEAPGPEVAIMPIGRPIQNNRIYILDAALEPVPPGVAGEVYIGGVAVGRGYLYDRERTASAFIPDPFGPEYGARLYKTGDMARFRPDGNMEYLGRIDHQVKIRGHRIELGEIESALSKFPGVKSCVVTAHGKIHGNELLVAYVAGPQELETKLEPAEIRLFLKDKLPDYMMPNAFVVLEKMPLNANGKIDRKALPAPDLSHVNTEAGDSTAPRNPAEEMLAGMWCEVLGLESAGIRANFFENGGHSLLATQLISRIRDAFKIELPLRTIFEAPTIEALAARIAERKFAEPASAEPIHRAKRPHALPLSFAQQRLWFLDRLEGGSATYNIPIALRMTGNFGISVFEECMARVVERHESLRTIFASTDGNAEQIIQPPFKVHVNLVDLTAHSDAEKRVHEIADSEALKPFDLQRGPLFRLTVLKLGASSHVLLLTLHHIISDLWSGWVLVHELGALYTAAKGAQAKPPPELPIQYADFTLWQREILNSPALDKRLGYWKHKLAGIPRLLELPADRPRPPVQTFSGSLVRFAIDPALAADLRKLSRRHGATLFMTLEAAFATLLSRICRQDDIVIGTPVANRDRQELEGLIGFFVNTLVLRNNLNGNPRFTDLLTQVRQTALEAYANQDIPFERVVEALQPERNLSHSPLFQVMFAYQNAPHKTVTLPGLCVEALESDRLTSKFDLTLEMEELPEGGLGGAFEYNTALFERESIQRIIAQFQCLLAEIAKEPGRLVRELNILPESEFKTVTAAFNHTTADYPDVATLHELFEVQAAENADGIAVICRGESLTYRALNTRANQIARRLSAINLRPDDRIAVLLNRSAEMIAVLLGILKAGAAYVPIDPEYPVERVEFTLADSGCKALLTDATHASAFNSKVPCVDVASIPGGARDNPEHADGNGHLAYVIYTSGSTGRPKGVMVEHRTIVNTLFWRCKYYPFSTADRTLQVPSFAFDSSVEDIFTTLISGGTLILIEQEKRLELAHLADLAQRHAATNLLMVPSLYRQMLSAHAGALKGLRFVTLAGESTGPDLIAAHFEHLPHVRLFNEYGPTENSVCATAAELFAEDATQQMVSIGAPISNVEIYVLSSELRPQPVNVAGELCISGKSLARGYLGNEPLTQSKFAPHPFEAGERIYLTGDVARWRANGTLEFLGRDDDQVKIRGYRIELGEIENVMAAHPAVSACAANVYEDVPGQKRLAAYIVWNGAAPAISDFRTFLRQKLPDYMIPAAFVPIQSLPRLTSGKVDRRKLPAPVSPAMDPSTAHGEPNTHEERVLADIWAQVLRIPSAGVHANFFELGGDSILSMQIVARARQAGLELTPSQIFQHQTIAELASAAARSTHAQSPIIAPAIGTAPLTPIQHWFLEQNQSEPQHYNQSVMFETDAGTDPIQLKRALETVVTNHDAFRLRFWKDAAGWHQEYLDATPEFFNITDVSKLSPTEKKAAIEARVDALQKSLNLDRGELLRAAYFNFGDSQPGRLLMIVHHLVIDGVSWRILVEDFCTASAQLQSSPRTASYKQWAERINTLAASDSVRAEQEYWLGVTRRQSARIPTDNSDSPSLNTVANSGKLTVNLSREETRSLLHDVPRVYHTQINDVLLTGLALAVQEWTGMRSVFVELEAHGRDAIDGLDVSRTVGWFTALYPALLELPEGKPSEGAALAAIKEQLRRIPRRGHGYGLLRFLHPDLQILRTLAEAPRPNIVFNYLGQIDAVQYHAPLRGIARESCGAAQSPSAHRPYLLELNCAILNGELRAELTYGTRIHRRETVEKFANGFVRALEKLITHCRAPEAGGFTASDFPAAKLDDTKLNKIAALLNKTRGRAK